MIFIFLGRGHLSPSQRIYYSHPTIFVFLFFVPQHPFILYYIYVCIYIYIYIIDSCTLLPLVSFCTLTFWPRVWPTDLDKWPDAMWIFDRWPRDLVPPCLWPLCGAVRVTAVYAVCRHVLNFVFVLFLFVFSFLLLFLFLVYSRTSLTDHRHTSTTPLYRSLHFGPIQIF